MIKKRSLLTKQQFFHWMMIDFEAVLKNGLMVKIDYVTAKKLAVEMQKLEIEITIENLKKMDTAALEK
jgi:hypothetical protein